MLYSRRHLGLYLSPFFSLLSPHFLVLRHLCFDSLSRFLALSTSRFLALAFIYSVFPLDTMPADRFISAFDADGKGIDCP